MTNDEFAQLVHRMRITQKEYFATSSKTILKQAKQLEREVDEALKTILPAIAGIKQSDLFYTTTPGQSQTIPPGE